MRVWYVNVSIACLVGIFLCILSVMVDYHIPFFFFTSAAFLLEISAMSEVSESAVLYLGRKFLLGGLDVFAFVSVLCLYLVVSQVEIVLPCANRYTKLPQLIPYGLDLDNESKYDIVTLVTLM